MQTGRKVYCKHKHLSKCTDGGSTRISLEATIGDFLSMSQELQCLQSCADDSPFTFLHILFFTAYLVSYEIISSICICGASLCFCQCAGGVCMNEILYSAYYISAV